MTPRYFDAAFASLPQAVRDFAPNVGVILGSGWGNSLLEMPFQSEVPYSAIPGFGASTVASHAGILRTLKIAEKRIIAFFGRRHYYEGVGFEPTILPVELLRRLGTKKLILTNAAGGINPSFLPGDIVLIEDHISLSGINPLQGEHHLEWGERFPDQSEIYSKELCNKIEKVASKNGIAVKRGIYAYTQGPTYETPAEVRAYAKLGADLVGMSTAPEAIFANGCNIKVAAISCVTNMAAGVSQSRLSHEDVIETSKATTPKMAKLIDIILREKEI